MTRQTGNVVNQQPSAYGSVTQPLMASSLQRARFTTPLGALLFGAAISAYQRLGRVLDRLGCNV